MAKFLRKTLILFLILFFIYTIGELFYDQLKTFYVRTVVRNFIQEIEIKYLDEGSNNYDEKYIKEFIKEEKLEDKSEKLLNNIQRIEGIDNFKINDLKEFAYNNKELDLDIKIFNLDFLDDIFN